MELITLGSNFHLNILELHIFVGFKLFSYSFIYMDAYLHTLVHHMCAVPTEVSRGHSMGLLEIELQMVVSCIVSAGN